MTHPYLMVAATTVSDNLHTRECQGYVRGQRREKLFAGLCRQHSVIQQQRCIAKAASPLPSDLSDLWRQAILLNRPCALPGFEVPGFPVKQSACLSKFSMVMQLRRVLTSRGQKRCELHL